MCLSYHPALVRTLFFFFKSRQCVHNVLYCLIRKNNSTKNDYFIFWCESSVCELWLTGSRVVGNPLYILDQFWALSSSSPSQSWCASNPSASSEPLNCSGPENSKQGKLKSTFCLKRLSCTMLWLSVCFVTQICTHHFLLLLLTGAGAQQLHVEERQDAQELRLQIIGLQDNGG